MLLLPLKISLLVLLSGTPGVDTTATAKPFVLQRLTAPIVLDGFSDEAAWRDVKPLPMTMFTPTFRGEPTERTEIRVAYDDDNIYISGRLFTTNPASIQANSLIRDLDRAATL